MFIAYLLLLAYGFLIFLLYRKWFEIDHQLADLATSIGQLRRKLEQQEQDRKSEALRALAAGPVAEATAVTASAPGPIAQPEPARPPLPEAQPSPEAQPLPEGQPLPEAQPPDIAAVAPVVVDEPGPMPTRRHLRHERPAVDDGPSESLEQTLASRWLVWLGGITLAIGGIFLVRWAAEQGLFGPAARMGLAFLIGIALVVGGERLRRRPLAQGLGMLRPDQVPASMVASGLFIAMTSTYGALMLYQLIGPTVAFIVLALFSIAALVLALAHGVFVGLLGLGAGLLIPILIPTEDPSPWLLLGWLIILTGATAETGRRLNERMLIWAAAGGDVVWSVALTASEEYWPGTILALVLPALLLVREAVPRLLGEDDRREADTGDGPRAFVVAGAVMLAATVCNMLVSLGAGVTVGAVAIAMAINLAAAHLVPVMAHLTLAVAVAGTLAALMNVARMLADHPVLDMAIVAAFAFMPLVGIGVPRPSWLSRPLNSVSVTVPPLLLLVVCWQFDFVRIGGPGWTVAAVMVMLALAWATMAAHGSRRKEGEEQRGDAGLIALGAATAAGLALVIALDGLYLTIAFALLTPILAAIIRFYPLPRLSIAIAVFMLIVLVRLLLNPELLELPIKGPVHWIVWAFGIPALALFAAMKLYPAVDSDGEKVSMRELLMVGALILAVALPTLEIQAYAVGTLRAGWFDLLPTALRSLLWLSVGAFLVWRFRKGVVGDGGWGLGELGVAQLALLQLLMLNPLWSGETVGPWPVLNLLLLAYLVPVVPVVAGALFLPAGSIWRTVRLMMAGVLLFTWATLSLRQMFQGTDIGLMQPTSDAELYAYSVLWLALALVTLGIAIRFRLTLVRHIALATLLLTVAKVFLVDMSDLRGLLRILSFFGLGASLIGIGWLYQRFVYPTTLAQREPGAG